MTDDVAERYLRLGLQLGRHVEGLVDAYYGPPELQAAVDAAAPVDPHALVVTADDLLGALEDCWLRDQVASGCAPTPACSRARCIRTPTRSRAATAFGPSTRTSRSSKPHTSASSSSFPVADRSPSVMRASRSRFAWPAEQVERTVAAAIAQARAATRRIVDLPEGESVALETVRDEPWLAFCGYRGALQSGIAVNLDLPMSAIDLLILSIHETYPGHHAERCCKEQLLVHGRGLLEETIVLVPTPQSLLSEGIATLAPFVLLESDDGEAFAAVIRAAGIDFDLPHALAVRRALNPCQWAEVNAVLMLYEKGASDESAHDYLRRWELMTRSSPTT